MCGSRQAENLCESIAFTGKSESVLRAAVPACSSLDRSMVGKTRIERKPLC